MRKGMPHERGPDFRHETEIRFGLAKLAFVEAEFDVEIGPEQCPVRELTERQFVNSAQNPNLVSCRQPARSQPLEELEPFPTRIAHAPGEQLDFEAACGSGFQRKVQLYVILQRNELTQCR